MKCKKSPALISLKQALGVAVYCGLIASFFMMMEKLSPPPDGSFKMIALMLLILVFSAAITGALVFAYPAYLVVNKEVKKGLSILGYTFLYLLLIIILAVFLIFV